MRDVWFARCLNLTGASASIVLLLLALLSGSLVGCSALPWSSSQGPHSASDEVFRVAFEQHQRNLQVEGHGIVKRVLADDNAGSRHQRFIIELDSGQTLLIAHNIDLARRIQPLQPGDEVTFRGVYEWNPDGGVVHWTHHDPDGKHSAGWLKHRGTTYQ